jgi:hypothetical protein
VSEPKHGKQGEQRSPLEALLEPALRHDPSGRGWLTGLLAAAPRGRARLGELVDQPGSLSMTLTVPGVSGRLGCFEYPAPPARELIAWLIDHPDALTSVVDAGSSPEARRLRGLLLRDEPPGSRARAQERARELLATSSPFTPAWWRFEDAAVPECVLLTDRLVLTVQTDTVDPLAPATPWYPSRSRLVRDLEAGRQLAAGRAYGSLLIADDGETGELPIADLVATGTPHLDAAARDELAGAFLGSVGWTPAGAAVATPG